MKLLSHAITVTFSPDIEDGTFVYSRRGGIVAISTYERRKWLAQFGLRQSITPDFDTVILSEGDYRAVVNEPAEEVPFQ